MVEEAHVWRSEDNRKKSVLSFHQLFALTMSSKDQTQVVRLVGKQPCLLSHFTSPLANFQMFKINMKQSLKNKIMKLNIGDYETAQWVKSKACHPKVKYNHLNSINGTHVTRKYRTDPTKLSSDYYMPKVSLTSLLYTHHSYTIIINKIIFKSETQDPVFHFMRIKTCQVPQ